MVRRERPPPPRVWLAQQRGAPLWPAAAPDDPSEPSGSSSPLGPATPPGSPPGREVPLFCSASAAAAAARPGRGEQPQQQQAQAQERGGEAGEVNLDQEALELFLRHAYNPEAPVVPAEVGP